MGDIVGDVIGLAGGALGGITQQKGQQYAADKAAETARLGFDYLKGSPLGTSYLPNGGVANNAIGNLLGVTGDPTAQNNAFSNYQNSTGTQFQLDEGSKAITTNSAAKGLLNSGATLKALTKYGQNLGSTTFNNYLSQLGGLQQAGLSAGGAIGGAGGQAGAVGANAALQGYGAAATTAGNTIGGAAGQIGNAFAKYMPGNGGGYGFPDSVPITGRQ